MTYTRVFLLTLAGTLAAAGLWMGLVRRDRRAALPVRRLLALVLAVGLGCRVAIALLTPTFYAPDEQSHFKYVAYLAEHRGLPVQSNRTEAASSDWEYYQPPLYYVLAAPLYGLSQRLGPAPAASVRLLRLLSIALWGVTLVFTGRLLTRLGVRDEFLRLFVVGMLCLVPTYAFVSSSVNNDGLLIALGSVILFLGVRDAPSLRRAIPLGLLLGLALLTKLSAIVYVAVVGLMGVRQALAGRVRARAIGSAVLAIALGLAMWAPWAWRSWRLYGSVSGEDVANVVHQWKSGYHGVLSTVEYIQSSFWAVSGVHNNVHVVYPLIGMHVVFFAIVGLLVGTRPGGRRLADLVGGRKDTVIALGLAIAINLALVMRFGILYAQGQGRLLYPLLGPIALLLGLGWKGFRVSDTSSARVHLVGVLVTYVVSFTCYSLGMFALLGGAG